MPAVTVLYGTQSGTAEYVAELTAAALTAAGFAATHACLDTVTPPDLDGCVALVVATYGEGEMPEDTLLFWKALSAPNVPRLPGLRYAVCALGDSVYDEFCAAGRMLDDRLAELGATRLLPRTECDVDYETPSQAWTAALVGVLGEDPGRQRGTPAAVPPVARTPSPVPVVLAASRRLSGPGSDKDVRHHELDLTGSGLTYEVGDALAVVPRNDPRLAAELAAHLGTTDPAVTEALTAEHDIGTPSRDLLAALAERAPALRPVLDDPAGRRPLLHGRDVLDLLRLSGARFTPGELLPLLRPLRSRAYSIASSPLTDPGRVHLTVATVRWRGDGRDRGGVCSTHLADRVAVGAAVPVLLHPNPAFRPPPDDVDMIMIGPGVGVAPFRGFLHERRARGARGRNWLFTGDRHRAHDLLYGDELAAFHDDGLLTRLDLAFSRDGTRREYVQTRMRAQGRELAAWLESGAHVYVCGDATRMAPDVEACLQEVVATHLGVEAEAYVDELRRSRRYLRDVY